MDIKIYSKRFPNVKPIIISIKGTNINFGIIFKLIFFVINNREKGIRKNIWLSEGRLTPNNEILGRKINKIKIKFNYL